MGLPQAYRPKSITRGSSPYATIASEFTFQRFTQFTSKCEASMTPEDYSELAAKLEKYDTIKNRVKVLEAGAQTIRNVVDEYTFKIAFIGLSSSVEIPRDLRQEIGEAIAAKLIMHAELLKEDLTLI